MPYSPALLFNKLIDYIYVSGISIVFYLRYFWNLPYLQVKVVGYYTMLCGWWFVGGRDVRLIHAIDAMHEIIFLNKFINPKHALGSRIVVFSEIFYSSFRIQQQRRRSYFCYAEWSLNLKERALSISYSLSNV